MLMVAAVSTDRMGRIKMAGENMKFAIRLILACLGVAVLTSLPWIFKWSWVMGWVAIAVLIVWLVWLVVLYLNWARGLKGPGTPGPLGRR